MGLLASIVAYLSVVAVMVVGFIMSADAVLNHSHHHQQTTDPRPEITTAAKAGASQTKKGAKPLRNAAELRAIPQKSTATAYRSQTELSKMRFREPHRRAVHEVQRRSSPSHREPAAAPSAFGYAEESGRGGDPWR